MSSRMRTHGAWRLLANVALLILVAELATAQQTQTETLEPDDQFGARQILVQTHVFREAEDAVETLGIAWSQIEAPVAIGKTTKTEQPDAPTVKEHPTLVDLYRDRKQPFAPELPTPEGVTGATWATASSRIESTTPVLYSLLAPEEYQRVMERSKRLSTLERVISPSVIVYSGQVATMNSTVERSFVTGIQTVVDGESKNQPVVFSPTVQVFAEGTKMRFLPRLQNESEWRLGSELEVCKILDVDTLSLPRPDGRGQFTIQIPEVATTKYRSELLLPVDFALAVKVFEKDRLGNRSSLIILCRCSLRDLEMVEKAALRPARLGDEQRDR